MSETADYLLKLFRFQLAKGDHETARKHLQLLSLHLSPDEIERLNSELPRLAKQIHTRRSERQAERPHELSDKAKQIRTFLAERQVQHLVHFTHIDNVTTILDRGLLPRARLDRLSQFEGFAAITNDQFRHDNHRDASCLSISFPNYLMFYALRQKLGIDASYWAVLLLRPEILWQKDCAYTPENAARRWIRERPIERWKTFDALHELFEDFRNESTFRARSKNLAPFLTTNPQAEVLAFDAIEPEFIEAVCVCDGRELPYDWRIIHPDLEVRVEPAYFDKRADYAEWSSGRSEEAVWE